MSTWTTIPDSSLEPGKPARSIDALALRDNPVAIAQGAPGAPKIDGSQAYAVEAAALNTDNAMRDWVLARTAAASVGAVGTYAMLRSALVAGTFTAGTTYAGSDLRYSGVQITASNAQGGTIGGATPSGTWRAMGTVAADASFYAVTLFLRIS